MKTKKVEKPKDQMTRKEALKKAGKYAAFTAIGAIVLLTPKVSQAGSPSPRQRGFGY